MSRQPLAPAQVDGTLRAHDRELRRFAYRMTGTAEAMDDVLWDAYYSAHQESDRLGPLDILVWLYHLVHRSCRDLLTRDDVRPSPTEPLLRILGALTVDGRALVLLVDGEGLPLEPAAFVVDTTVDAAQERLDGARADLRELTSPGGDA